MKKQFTPWDLGATLYMPATRSDLVEVVLDGKIPGLRSLVVCLEDAVSEHDVPLALQNLSLFLQSFRGYFLIYTIFFQMVIKNYFPVFS